MDHHCMITDNCVGRDNFKYFLHFCGWAAFTLLSGLAVFWGHVYTYNRRHKIGLQSLYQLCFVTNPMTISLTFLRGDIDFVGVFDSFYIAILLVLLFIVCMPMCNTLINIFY